MTVDGRYGPYGFGEEEEDYRRRRVDWDKVDWGKLQNDCFKRNAHRFPKPAEKFDHTSRFQLRNRTKLRTVGHWNDFRPTRRTALIIRAFDGYEYKAEDLIHIRSLIVEAALRTGGEYAVVLLVNIKDSDRNIFESKAHYQQALDDAKVPPELQPIAVLWDDNLLESWYPAVSEHR